MTQPRIRRAAGVLAVLSAGACTVALPAASHSEAPTSSYAELSGPTSVAIPLADPAQEPPDFRSDRRPESTPLSFEQLQLDAFWIPAMWVTADVDADQTPVRADFGTGSGFGARIGAGNENEGIGLLYMESSHDEKQTDSSARTQSAYLDFLFRAPLADTGPLVWLQVDGGVGLAWITFSNGAFDPVTTGAAELRGSLEFRVAKQVAISAGVMGFIWGHPGDTIAYGTAATLGVVAFF